MRHVFIMDPIESVLIDRDSTFALMVEAQARGHEVDYVLASDLYSIDDSPRALARKARLKLEQGRHAELSSPRDIDLRTADVIWMRKDPPFDMDYVFCTYILDLAAADALVVNEPAGLRTINEKTWATAYPDLIPQSLITQSPDRIRAFLGQHGALVLKPLDGNGGDRVFVLRDDDPNVNVIIEVSTGHGSIKVMAQRFVPEAREGDKRIILVEGEPVGAILRVPTGVDHRGNIHVGARVESASVDGRDREICDAIGPALRDQGQLFVGIDVIGGYMTEVNVTSPTGIHEINTFDGVCVESMLVDAAIERLRTR